MENGAIQIERFPESHKSPCEEAVIAPSGHVLYQLESSVRLARFGSVFIIKRRRVILTLKSRSDDHEDLSTPGKIKESWFNASSTWAFAWYVKGRYHYVKAWKVSDTSTCTTFEHKLVSQLERRTGRI